MLMSISGLVPLPSDALVTPVTFRVRRRKLRGILQNFDAAEDGTRELSGEWVVGKKTWQRLQNEWRAAKAKARVGSSTQPTTQKPKKRERVVLYLHGGRSITVAAFLNSDMALLRRVLYVQSSNTQTFNYSSF